MDDGSLATNASPGAPDSKALSRAAAPGPTRIRSLDVLRGVGVLGLGLLHAYLLRLGPVAAVGRMALTNYLLQTLICTTVFYGHGLGLFGQVDRAGQFAIVNVHRAPSWLGAARSSSGSPRRQA